MLIGIVILMFFQILGELTVTNMQLILPGPVVGMVYFFGALTVMPSLKSKVEELSRFMNAHLALFFIPAGVGMMKYYDLFLKYGLAIVLTLLLSTAFTLGSTAFVFNFILKYIAKRKPHE